MEDKVPKIDQNAYLSGKMLKEALFEFGNPELIEMYSQKPGKTKTSPPPGGILLEVLQSVVLDFQEIQNTKNRQEKILELLKKDILEKIQKSDLIPVGFKIPRVLRDSPIEIPADLFFSGKIDWENSELKYKNLEFSGIRLLKDLSPIIDIKLKNNENYEIKKIGNSKSKDSERSKKRNFSDLDPQLHIDEKEAGQFLGLSPKTLQGYRVKGGGPTFIKIGKKAVRYKIADLIKWSEDRKKENTSQY